MGFTVILRYYWCGLLLHVLLLQLVNKQDIAVKLLVFRYLRNDWNSAAASLSSEDDHKSLTGAVYMRRIVSTPGWEGFGDRSKHLCALNIQTAQALSCTIPLLHLLLNQVQTFAALHSEPLGASSRTSHCCGYFMREVQPGY